eukprot:5258482-Pleurochrysis_carterae.AAC.1
MEYRRIVSTTTVEPGAELNTMFSTAPFMNASSNAALTECRRLRRWTAARARQKQCDGSTECTNWSQT